MLSDIIAPGRLRAGDPQALAALVAVGGWSVVSYCERAGAGDEAARAVVLAFVTFRRRAIQGGDEAATELERMLLDSARDAVDELRGEEPGDDAARAGEEAFAQASPRPLSPRLATATLHALVEAAPVDGDPAQVRVAAERGYAAAYDAAEQAPAIAGEQALGPASALLLRAAQVSPSAPKPMAPSEAESPLPTPSDAELPLPLPPPSDAELPPPPPSTRVRRTPAVPPLAARLGALAPAQRAAAFAGALAVLVLLIALLGRGGDDPGPTATTVTAPPRTVTVTQTTTTPGAASSNGLQVVRSTPRRPLSASGGRFEVVPTANASWAQEVRAEEPRRGTRWVTVAVRTRNVRRRDLVLRTLGYRLRTEGGVVLGPRALEVAEGPPRSREGRLPVGARASVHLGFEVPFDAGRLSIAFEPGGLDEPTVLVPIGSN